MSQKQIPQEQKYNQSHDSAARDHLFNRLSQLSLAVLVLVVLGVLIAIKCLFSSWDHAATVNSDAQNYATISVSGTAESEATPDIITLSYSLIEEDVNLETAQDTLNEQAAQLHESLKNQFKIEDKDITTESYNFYPRYDYVDQPGIRSYSNSNRVLSGYEVTQRETLQIRDFEKAQTIVSFLAESGVDNLSNLQFAVEDLEAAQEELRAEAIADAKEKAQVLADQLGVSLVRIVSFDSGGRGYYPEPMMRMEAMSMASDEMAESKASLNPGSEEVSVEVYLTYEIDGK